MEKVTCQICKEYSAHNLISHLRATHPVVVIAVYSKTWPVVSDRAKQSMSISHVGTKLSTKTRKRLSAAHKGNPKCAEAARKTKNRKGTKTSKQARENMRNGALGKVISSETKTKMSNSQKKRYESLDLRRKVSKGASEAIRKGRRNRNRYKTGYWTTRFGRYYYRSSYERRFLQLVDRDLQVVSVQYEKLTLVYDGYRHYVPDYLITLLDGRKFLIEVKPNSLVGACLSKFQSGKDWCLKNNAQFVVVTETFLNSSSTTTSLWETAKATAATSKTKIAG